MSPIARSRFISIFIDLFRGGRGLRGVALLALLTTAIGAGAQTPHYIRDVVYVPLRSGPSAGHRILDNLASGEAVTIVGAPSEGYVEVRTADGEQGWLETQYLVDQPVARERLEAAQAETAKLRKQNRELQTQMEAVAAEQSSATAQVAALQTSERQLREELERIRALSADSVRLGQQNEELATEAQQLRTMSGEIQAENERLTQQLQRDQFMNGAYAVALGVGLALAVPRLWPRRRRSEWG